MGGNEMKLVSMKDYVNAVRNITANRFRKSVNIYLATEDPKAATSFIQNSDSDWNIYVDRTIQLEKGIRPIDEHEIRYKKMDSKMATESKGLIGRYVMAAFVIAVEADDYVLTTKSNWSRLMNEVRLSVIDKMCGNCTNMIDLRQG